MFKRVSFSIVIIVIILILLVLLILCFPYKVRADVLDIKTKSRQVTLGFSGRKSVQQAIFESTFVINPDELVKLALEVKKSPNWPKTGKPRGKFNASLSIPENYLAQSMTMYEEIDLRTMTLSVWQLWKTKKVPLINFKIASGMNGMETPQGNFCIKRVTNRPIYYPPKEWPGSDKPVQPGKNNPYGLWMSEILKFSTTPASYEFGPAGRLTKNGVNQHSTNKPRSIGRRASHACVRIHPKVAANLFPFFLHFTPHLDGKKVARGTVYPFQKGHLIYVKIFTSKKIKKAKVKSKPTLKGLLENVPPRDRGVFAFSGSVGLTNACKYGIIQ